MVDDETVPMPNIFLRKLPPPPVYEGPIGANRLKRYLPRSFAYQVDVCVIHDLLSRADAHNLVG